MEAQLAVLRPAPRPGLAGGAEPEGKRDLAELPRPEQLALARTIGVADVIKALEIAADRLGDRERAAATLRSWAEAGRVTPAGQVLTPEAVDAGLRAWRGQAAPEAARSAEERAAPAPKPQEQWPSVGGRRPATPLGAARRPREGGARAAAGAGAEVRAAKAGAVAGVGPAAATPVAGVLTAAKPVGSLAGGPAPSPPRSLASIAAAAAAAGAAAAAVFAGGKVPVPAAAALAAVADAEDAAPAAAKRRKLALPTFEEAKQARLQQEARARGLAERRLEEVLAEITGHMEEILKHASPSSLEAWRAAPAGHDRRELFARLVHERGEPEAGAPEELCAELMPHQVEGLEWLASLYANGLHGILADEMGLGKTIQTIALLLHLKERKGNVGPHFVVAPKSTLSNWQSEFQRFAPSFSVHVLTGDLEEREAELASLICNVAQGLPCVCVTNYEQVYRNDWLAKNQWQVVVVDEGHRLKNPETVLHGAMAKLRCRMRLLLTGTPVQNGLNELWALLHYLLPDMFTCMMDFKAWFAKPFRGVEGLNEFEVHLDPEQEQQVVAQMHALLAPFLLQRLKAEVLSDLPPKLESVVRVPLSAWQAAAYKDLEKRTVRLLGEGDSVSSEQVNNALMQLRKIALHPYMFQDARKLDAGLFRASGKAEVLDRLLPKFLQFGHKVLVFSQFTSVLDILEDLLRWRSIQYVRLDGSVPHEQRRERIERFNTDPNVGVFLISARAGGLGLNLQAADTVILFDLDWNPQNDKQAVARAHRVGQTREVRVLRLITDSPVERHMEQRCQEKLEMEKKIMGAGMFRRQASVEDRRQALRAVLGLAEEGAAAVRGLDNGSSHTSPEELNELTARSEEELRAFASMDGSLLKPSRPGSRRSSARGAAAPSAVEQLLLRSGRLLSQAEVPKGFAAGGGGQ